jgi:Tol biopolymer transport system component
MSSDDVGRWVKETVLASAPEPDAELRARTLGAMTASRAARRGSRRRPVAIAVAACLVLLGGVAVAVATGILWLPDEGTLYFSGAVETPLTGIVTKAVHPVLTPRGIETGEPPAFDADLSPSGDEWVFSGMYDWPPVDEQIFRQSRSGEEIVGLTDGAELAGVNCLPRWSPEGDMVVFQHADPEPGEMPCHTGFSIWVMNADGSGARRLTPQGSLPMWDASWSPDGSYILCNTYIGDWDSQEQAVLMDIEGMDVWPLPNVGSSAVFSPDGTKIASQAEQRGQQDGQPGVWEQLLLTDADGGNPEVLVQQFIADAELEARYPTEEQLAAIPDVHWLEGERKGAGPHHPAWSPRGDKIAFLAALPYDPQGPSSRQQTDVWIYDLRADELIRVTDDDLGQWTLRWK